MANTTRLQHKGIQIHINLILIVHKDTRIVDIKKVITLEDIDEDKEEEVQ